MDCAPIVVVMVVILVVECVVLLVEENVQNGCVLTVFTGHCLALKWP